MNKTIPTKLSIAKIIGVIALAIVSAALIRSIAEQRKAESSTWTRFLLNFHDSNTGLIEVINGMSVIHYASPEASTILGYNDRELEGVSLSDILPPDMAAQHQIHMFYAMGLASSGQLKTHVTAMLCKARRFDGSLVDVVIRLYIGKQSIFATINLASETKYLAPSEPATDYNTLRRK